MPPSRTCSSVRDRTSETRNTNVWNSVNNYQKPKTQMYEIRWIIILPASIQTYYPETRCIIDSTTHFSYRNINRSSSSMERSPYWEATSSAASQDTPHISWNPEVRYRVHIKVTIVLLGFVAYRLRKRKIKWWLNIRKYFAAQGGLLHHRNKNCDYWWRHSTNGTALCRNRHSLSDWVR